MAIAKLQNTAIGIREKILEKYVHKTWFIFGWYEQVSATHIKNDLVINTAEDYDKIYLNGQELEFKKNNGN